MGLADYQPERHEVKLKGGSFIVKGLSLTEFTTLIQHHMPDLEAIYALGQQVLSGKTELTQTDVMQLVVVFAEQAPGLVANVIALASGDGSEKAVDAARTLPFPVQVDVMVTIINLTFDEVGGVKKAMESVAGLLSTMKKPEVLKKLRPVR